ncbi:GNAT family N-acetyltransferase [Kitasatospora sp. NPDC093806]|uniref:GNAT family N-acetyltransferase n=1 Tax=Kitasatospora sp. NPDC093806 TaxID=3155075 RepID=UPI003430C2F7
MELVPAEPLGSRYRDTGIDADTTFRYWKSELHRPQVLVWTGRRRVATVLDERRPDGSLVLSGAATADGPGGGLADLRPDGRLALAFRADAGRLRRGRLVPLFSTDYRIDHRRGRIEVRFPLARGEERTHPLPEPVAARLDCGVLFGRPQRIAVTRLSPYGGEFSTEDPGRCLAPGMTVTIDSWLPWLGRWRLTAQLTACREDATGVRFAFRTVDRRSVRAGAVVLAGTVPGFGFDALRSAGVRPARMTRYLSVRTVADEAGYRRALDVRLAGNRHFGRLAGVDDSREVADRLDPHSVNFVCLLGDKAVGAGRVVVNGGDRSLSEIEAGTAGLPVHIWRGGFVEVSRLAVDPEHRGAGVVVALFREIARLAFNLDCRYLVLDAIDKLVPVYRRLGGERLPLAKAHQYSGETVHVMAIDIGAQLGRLDRRWPQWQYVFGPVLDHHLRTSPPEALTGRVRGLGVVPFWLKRIVGRAL